jgi:hypothetical protein
MMYALRQIYDNPQDMIPVPKQMRHHRMEVIFMALDDEPKANLAENKQNPIIAFAGCWVDANDTSENFDAEIDARRQSANRERDEI